MARRKRRNADEVWQARYDDILDALIDLVRDFAPCQEVAPKVYAYAHELRPSLEGAFYTLVDNGCMAWVDQREKLLAVFLVDDLAAVESKRKDE